MDWAIRSVWPGSRERWLVDEMRAMINRWNEKYDKSEPTHTDLEKTAFPVQCYILDCTQQQGPGVQSSQLNARTCSSENFTSCLKLCSHQSESFHAVPWDPPRTFCWLTGSIHKRPSWSASLASGYSVVLFIWPAFALRCRLKLTCGEALDIQAIT